MVTGDQRGSMLIYKSRSADCPDNVQFLRGLNRFILGFGRRGCRTLQGRVAETERNNAFPVPVYNPHDAAYGIIIMDQAVCGAAVGYLASDKRTREVRMVTGCYSADATY